MVAVDALTLMPEARYAMQARRNRSACADLFQVLDSVKDPEIPVLSIWDLGILQDVQLHGGTVKVVLTPTYTGCPAMQQIAEDVTLALQAAGCERVEVEHRLSPAWTTDWMAPDAKRRLVAFGIASPDLAACPLCDSNNVEVVSEFGSTACKALLRCKDCGEPFDQFKRF